MGDRIADRHAACRCGVDVERGGETGLVNQMLHNVLGHGGTADIAVADEKYSYHILKSS